MQHTMDFTMYIGVLYLFYVSFSWAFASTVTVLFFLFPFQSISFEFALCTLSFTFFYHLYNFETRKTIFFDWIPSSLFSLSQFVSPEKKKKRNRNLIKMKMTKRNFDENLCAKSIKMNYSGVKRVGAAPPE